MGRTFVTRRRTAARFSEKKRIEVGVGVGAGVGVGVGVRVGVGVGLRVGVGAGVGLGVGVAIITIAVAATVWEALAWTALSTLSSFPQTPFYRRPNLSKPTAKPIARYII